jgi:hypothetical protein
MRPVLPNARGTLSDMLCSALRKHPHALTGAQVVAGHQLCEEDLQLSLHLCFGLHYDGFAAVDDRWEWSPPLLSVRSLLEDQFLDLLRQRGVEHLTVPEEAETPGSLVARVERSLRAASGPSLSTYLLEDGTYNQLREFVIHRSVYQRKEADPHTWVIPRLRGRAKSACVRLQCDEYGNGDLGRSHAELFAATMEAFDLNPTPGAYVDFVPATTLATDNLVSLLGLHRQWRGALVGHLAAFEMTSVIPMARYDKAVRRYLPARAAEFYKVHVAADAVHARIAADELLTGLVETDPDAAKNVLFGVRSLLAVEDLFTDHLLTAWNDGRSSLREVDARCTGPSTWPTPAVDIAEGPVSIRPGL